MGLVRAGLFLRCTFNPAAAVNCPSAAYILRMEDAIWANRDLPLVMYGNCGQRITSLFGRYCYVPFPSQGSLLAAFNPFSLIFFGVCSMQKTLSGRPTHILVVLLLVLWLHTPSQGQTTQDSTVSNKALQFSLAGSSAAALKYWLTNNHVVTVGIQLESGTQISYPNASIFDPFADLRVGLFAQYDYYFLGRRQFAPFVGVVGNLSWRQSRLPNAVSYETSTFVGFNAGLECFVLPWLSVSGTLLFGGRYNSIRNESPIGTNMPYYTYTFNVLLANTGIAVSVYF